MPKVIVPPPYQGPTRGVAEVDVEATDVRSCVRDVEARFPGFEAQIFDASGQLHRFVKLFLNGEPVDGASLARAVEPGDTLEVMSPISGG